MKRPLLLAVLFCVFGIAKAQPYGNEWIDYTKQYWKVKIVAPTTDLQSLFRIDSTALANAGFPIGEDPHRIQFFGREKAVPIWIEGEADSVFNNGDYIEFHAVENDGWMDAGHWENPAHQNTTTYNQYSDTICYFLTLANPGEVPARIQPYQNTDFGGLPVRTWAWTESVVQNNAGYQKGERDVNSAQSGFMGSGEGWLSALANDITDGAPTVYNNPLTTAEAYYGPGAPDATLSTMVFGELDPCYNPQTPVHHVQLLYGQNGNQAVLLDDTLEAWETKHVSITIPNGQIVPSSIVTLKSIDIQPCSTAVTNYVSAISDIRLEYPRITDMLNTGVFNMWFDDDANEDDVNVQFGNVSGTPIFHVLNDDTTWRVQPTNVGGTYWSARLPANGGGDRTFLYGMNTVNVPLLTQVSLATPTGYFTNYAATELDSACIIVTHTSLLNEAQNYATYRENSPRNPMPTMVADVEELYHQYGGGTIKSGMAIRRFAKHLLETWSTAPQALFLIGKSVMAPTIGTDHGVRRPVSWQIPNTYQRCLVPTFGSPPSDVCLTVGLTGDPRVMAIPVGRLSAENGTEVMDYLAKVQSMEGFTEPREWMKNILHFRGGFTPSEWSQFSQKLAEWEHIAEDSLLFAGQVTNFRKNTGGIFDQAAADSVRHFIEDPDKGVTLMTFLAHASGQGFDINIDQPGGYNWQGKHPLLLGNSCYSGNIHLNYQGGSNSASENYVIAGDDGASGFLASVDIGTVGALSPYTNQFYRSFCYLNYGKSIGQHMKHAIFSQLSAFMSQSSVHNSHTMTLHGDPALVLPTWPLPEFTVFDEDVRIIPEQVTAELDTFIVQAVVTNIGAGTEQPVVVRMTRLLPNGTEQIDYQVQLDGLLYQETVEFKVPLLNDELGLNTFTVMIDLQPDEIPEQYEENINNRAVQTTTIISAELLPIWPYKFAITPETGPLLKASTSDPFAPTAPYVFQIDTTDLFNSPVMEMGTATAPGGVITWQPQFIYNLNNSVDSLVFFWRCSPDSTGPDGYKWKESSFQHIPNRTGWGQAHYFQFKDDTYNNVVYDRPNREFDFFTGQREIRVNVLGNSSGFQNNQNEWFIDLEWQDNNGCGGVPAFYVAIVDPGTFTPWITDVPGGLHDFGNYNWPGSFGCRQRPEAFFMFKFNSQPQLDGMRIMLQDSVPDGHYVMVYTWKYLNRFVSDNTPLGTPLYDYLEVLGATDIRNVPDSVPYIFMVRKGYPNTAIDTAGSAINSFISQTMFCTVDGNEGLMTSPPSMQFLDYEALYWDEKPRNANDSTTIRLWGREADGTETLLTQQFSPLDSLNALDTVVDPLLYPQVRVGAWLTDYNWPDAEPAQMRRWQILGDPAPECAIHPPAGFFVQADSLFEGQPGRVAVAVQNISAYDMDSLLLAAWIVDANNVRTGIHYHRNAPLPVGGIIMDTISFNTAALGGGNFIFIEANPVDSATGVYDQPEQYHFNNYASLRFTIQEDRENPLLDITFDGIHILDGDIVSAKPEIQMTLDDENVVLLMEQESDTGLFKVFLTPPGGIRQFVYFRSNGEEVMQFVPAEGAENIAKIFYRPTLAEDGKYTLEVQASDISFNASGDNLYKITFEVVNKPSITNVLNYPNPFTTSTRFVFTVTGSEPPTQMRVQIMTVSGRVVRTINAMELGPMHIGRNITEFAWDGTDEFGDKLARGVYLYRVDARLNGQDIERRESGADAWIEKGMGKMYLMR